MFERRKMLAYRTHFALEIKKIRRLKYLRDQLTCQEDCIIQQVLETMNPLWMEKRLYNKMFLSLNMLRSYEEIGTIVRKIAGKSNVRRLMRTVADVLDKSFLDEETMNLPGVLMSEKYRILSVHKAMISFRSSAIIHTSSSVVYTTILYCFAKWQLNIVMNLI